MFVILATVVWEASLRACSSELRRATSLASNLTIQNGERPSMAWRRDGEQTLPSLPSQERFMIILCMDRVSGTSALS